MKNNNHSLITPLGKGNKAQNKHFYGQMKTVFKAFNTQPKTMLMVSIETGILRANICRYVAKWQKNDSIHLVKQGYCKVSKHRSGYYSTNPDLFPTIDEPLKIVKS